MKVIKKAGTEDIAQVYIAETKSGRRIEFTESVGSDSTRDKKWVLVISSLYGCPVSCRFCDAGGGYKGKLSADEIFAQIDYPVKLRYPDLKIPSEKFKVQFARMGEPAFNPAVLEVLENLPERYDAPGLTVSLSTIAPLGCDAFFEKLYDISKRKYQNRFQFQFSLHTTDKKLRSWLIPVETWNFKTMAEYGKEFSESIDKKITLNFALAENMPLEPDVLLKYFSPDIFLVKITPVNPTFQAVKNGISSHIKIDTGKDLPDSKITITEALNSAGYDVIVSIGDSEENLIGSNCGQYLEAYEREVSCYKKDILAEKGYRYSIQNI
ncbi:MAG: radical SAM protein [Methanomicrobiaceae archaeon]|nr:radical SAM protein [Methanomicrobiaceae archaeon]